MIQFLSMTEFEILGSMTMSMMSIRPMISAFSSGGNRSAPHERPTDYLPS